MTAVATERPAPSAPARRETALSPDERAALGRAARRAAPRSARAEWERPAGAEDPLAIIEGQEMGRVPELVPIRHGRMLASPFAFFRGAAAIMAADLAGSPDSGLTVQACGDAHLANFGVHAAPDRRLVFDLNDFDETLRAPWGPRRRRRRSSSRTPRARRGTTRAGASSKDSA
jgi:hypothetical protein